MLKRFSIWLFKRYGEPELLDIARYKSGISSGLPLDLDGDIDVFQLPEGEREEFFIWAHTVKSHRYFGLIIDSMLKAQEREIVQYITKQELLNSARSARHGVETVREQFEILSDKFLALTSGEETLYDLTEIV